MIVALHDTSGGLGPGDFVDFTFDGADSEVAHGTLHFGDAREWVEHPNITGEHGLAHGGSKPMRCVQSSADHHHDVVISYPHAGVAFID